MGSFTLAVKLDSPREMKLFAFIILLHQATAFFWWPFQGINSKSRTSTYGFGTLFENIFSPNWRPIFGFSHSNKVSFGKGKGFSHGIRFNVGPKPIREKYNEMEILLKDTNGGTQPKTLLKSMTKPYVKKDKTYLKKSSWY